MNLPPPAAFFLRYWRFFAQRVQRQMIILGGLTLLTTWSEGVGIALLLPLLGGSSAGATGSVVAAWVYWALGLVGLPPTIPGVLVALVVVAFLKGALTFLSTSYRYYLAAKVTQDLRRELLTASEAVDYRYVVSTSTARLTGAIINETASASNAFLFFAELFPHLVTIVVFLVVVAVIDWRLSLLVVATGALITPILRYPARFARRYSARATEESVGLTSLMIQSLQAFKYLKATAGLERLRNRLALAVRRIAVLNYRIGASSALAYSLPQPVVALFLAGIMLYMLHSGGAAAISTGFVVLIYLYRTMNEIFALQAQWQAFSATIPSVDIVDTTLQELRANLEPAGTAATVRLTETLALSEVSFRYGDRTVLDRISLTIRRNSTVALVGDSGGGKTTLVDLLTGVLKPASGAVKVDGRDLREVDLAAWRRRIGYVPQDPVLFDASVADNISFWSCDAREPACLQKIEAVSRRALCDGFITEMPEKYSSRIGERGINLSGGQRQRLAISRELFKEPDLLILDEATSALDTESEHFVRQSIDALKGTVTVVVIAHRLSTIKGCDRIYVLKEGRILEEGTWEELLGREGSRLGELARLQSL